MNHRKGSKYDPTKPQEPNNNGLSEYGDFGVINLQTTKNNPKSGRGDFKFCVVASGTDTKIVLDRFDFSFYDLDERKEQQGEGINEKLIIDTSQVASYVLSPDTEITLSCEDASDPDIIDIPINTDNTCPNGYKTVFSSSTMGTGKDNPDKIANLNATQINRSVLFTFMDTSCFTFIYDHYCEIDDVNYKGNQNECKYSGGNLLFAGNSTKLCHSVPTDSPVVAPTESPVVDNKTDSPTVPPPPETDEPTPAPISTVCEDDVSLFSIIGATTVDIIDAVKIISYNSLTVEVGLYNAWTPGSDPPNTIGHIFYNYRESVFSEKCYEIQNVDPDDRYAAITIQCSSSLTPFAELEICVADPNGALDPIEDNAEIPECCQSTVASNTPTVCYTIVIHCERTCDESESTAIRSLRGS